MKTKQVKLYSVNATLLNGESSLLFIQPEPFNFNSWASTPERKQACKLLGCTLKCQEIIVDVP